MLRVTIFKPASWKLVFALGIFTALVVLMSMTTSQQRYVLSDTNTTLPAVKPTSSSDGPGRKLILFSNFPKVLYNFTDHAGPDGLKFCDASGPGGQMMCEVTGDKKRLSEADAVIFYSHHENKNRLGFEPIKRIGSTWSFFAEESPIHSGAGFFNNPTFHNKFNSTITYRIDSDFWYGYIRSQRLPKPLTAQDREQQEEKMREAFRRKTKMAAIFVSHCGAPSKRDNYINELKRHMDIDVYGRCGKLKCEDRVACDKMLEKQYKFYLAFENSNCFEYVTEKLMRPMQAKWIVPVVRGGADYSRLFPQNSVIDTSKFTSPKSVAEYLNAVAGDEDAWVKMLHWKFDWEMKGHEFPFCQYCHHLFTPQAPPKLYPNVFEWWDKDRCYKVTDI